MPNSNSYFIPSKEGNSLFKDKGSKFYGFVFSFTKEDLLKDILKNLKKKHPKAVHFCFAYKVGNDNKIFRSNDDGEPSGSAGKPILGQIESANATDILIVIVRYFGGTLLGVPGLINAYKNASREAIDNCGLTLKEVSIFLELNFPLDNQNQVMILLKKYEIENIKFISQEKINIEIITNKLNNFLAEAKLIWQLEISVIN